MHYSIQPQSRRANLPLWIPIMIRQWTNPILLILLIAVVISFILGDRIEPSIMLGMVIISTFLGFFNEYRAERIIQSLLSRITRTVTVIRGGKHEVIDVSKLLIGDEVQLMPGTIIPADMTLKDIGDLEIDESALTGESMPIRKSSETPKVYMGTTVISGSGIGIVTGIGTNTKYGEIGTLVSNARPETEFQRGLSSYGKLLMKIISVLVVSLIGANILLGRSPIESILFALSVAIGLTPEFLPVVVTVSLAYGAKQLGKHHLLVKRLVAIEDLGTMDILCSDKTGTLTEGTITLASHRNTAGIEDESVLRDAWYCNAAITSHHTGGDAIDTAILRHAKSCAFTPDRDTEKITQHPFDFEKRGMFSVISHHNRRIFLFKGSPDALIERLEITLYQKKAMKKLLHSWYAHGYRIVGIGKKFIEKKDTYSFDDAVGLELSGWLLFSDPPKKGIRTTLDHLEDLGVRIKILTGDNEIITDKICELVDIPHDHFITGDTIQNMSDEELEKIVEHTDVFAKLIPDQKLRIIKALKKNGHVVGFLGDGINDAPSLRTADAGICVDSATDIAKDAASIILLQKSLSVIVDGIKEGRRTFTNTMKYILMGTSSNFGNMFSMAFSSVFLPFLPLKPIHILLADSIYDFTQLFIPTDSVDREDVINPQHFSIRKITTYMMTFGPISSIFDFMTFGSLLFLFHANEQLFQTGWFVESLMTQILVVFVIRSKRFFLKSKPGSILTCVVCTMVLVALIIPYTPIGALFSFVPLPFSMIMLFTGFVILYLFMVEFIKQQVFRYLQSSSHT